MQSRSTALVVPCFNEADRLRPDAFLQAARHDGSLRFVFVDDGSRDETFRVLEMLCNELGPQGRLLRLASNSGKAEAVRRGVLEAISDAPTFVGYWDADLSTPLDAIALLRAELEAHAELEIALGARLMILGREIKRNPVRHWLGRVVATGISLVLDLPVYDTQCGAKLFRTSVGIEALFAEAFTSRWLFDVEILARWIQRHPDLRREGVGRYIHEVPLDQWIDVGGSRLGLRDFARTPIDLARIHLRYRLPRKPLSGPRLPG